MTTHTSTQTQTPPVTVARDSLVQHLRTAVLLTVVLLVGLGVYFRRLCSRIGKPKKGVTLLASRSSAA